MACKDCENSNPITPVYSGAKYVLNGSCADVCGPDIYVPLDSGGTVTHELIAGNDILIEDFSDANNLKHRISYDPFISLTTSLSVSAYVLGALQSSIVLKGVVVDETRSAWTYNKGVVASQTLDEGAGAVTVPLADRAKITTSLSITSDLTYTVEGDDGQGNIGSVASDSDSLLFGNYMIWGDYTNMTNQPVSQIPTLIADLASKNTEVKITRFKDVFATGLVNRKFFVIYPAVWGEAIFTKSGFEGGFIRLKNEAGTLVQTVITSESPITWTNEEGYTEEFYIYQSVYDNAEDLVTPIIIT